MTPLEHIDLRQNKFKLVSFAIAAILIFLSVIVIMLVASQTQKEQSYSFTSRAGSPFDVIPANDRAKGLIYDGLERSIECPRGFKVHAASRAQGRAVCTHGPDPAPEGVDLNKTPDPVAQAASGNAVLAATVTCDGDGVSGNRTQVIYARASDVVTQYTTYLSSFQQWALQADNAINNSAAETGGLRHIRFVHDFNCAPIVLEVTLSTTGDDTFSNTINELRSQGYNRMDRNYMIFMDSGAYCGIASISQDDSLSSTNWNNYGGNYGRTDRGCWSGNVAQHELMHNLGGVQLTAPHTSGGWHCVDESDRMCYSDSPYYPLMQYMCSSSHEGLFDCNHDDYFNTNPPVGSYLASHWNSANNSFLIGAASVPGPTATPTRTPTPIKTPTVGPSPTATPSRTPTPTPTGDITAPTITSYSPQNGATLSTKQKGHLNASDQSGISQLRIYLDTQQKASCGGVTTCTFTILTNKISRGSHTMRYEATDTRGNTAAVTVMITK